SHYFDYDGHSKQLFNVRSSCQKRAGKHQCQAGNVVVMGHDHDDGSDRALGGDRGHQRKLFERCSCEAAGDIPHAFFYSYATLPCRTANVDMRNWLCIAMLCSADQGKEAKAGTYGWEYRETHLG